jgi:pyruvate dehydrogenase E2 component (dihydrolipoamide acetyltransferase)
MATAVEMPKLGNTVEECVVTAWRSRAGDQVAAGDVIAEVETDKASFDITAPASGTLLELFFAEGDLVPVFTNLCVIGTAGESVDEFRPGAQGSAAPAAASAAPAPAPAVVSVPVPAAVGAAPVVGTSAGGPLSPRARRFAGEHGLPAGPVTGAPAAGSSRPTSASC